MPADLENPAVAADSVGMTGEAFAGACIRAWAVNGIQMAEKPLCPPGGHGFSAYHGYCVDCGADGWTAGQRRETQRVQREVRRG